MKPRRTPLLPLTLAASACLALAAAPYAAAQNLYSTDFDNNQILEYSLNGSTTPTTFASAGLLFEPQGLAFGTGSTLDVTAVDPNTGAGDILQYSVANPAAAPTLLAEGGTSSVFSDIAINNGTIYVADNAEDEVLKLTATGLQPFASGNGLTAPTGLTFDAAGSLYVGSTDPNSGLGDVLKFSSTGTYQSTLVAPGSGGLNAAGELAFSGGSLYVANGQGAYNQGAQTNGSLDRFTAAGAPVGSGTFASDPNLINPYGLAVAPNGNFFVGDQGSNTSLDPNNLNNGQIAEFSPNGTFVTYLTHAGNPYGLAISPAAVPEASTTVSFGLLLTLGIGVVLRRHTRASVSPPKGINE